MIYRTYGKTEKKVSAIGFGGMRFPEPQNIEKSVELVLYAHAKGITYFDTAPYYCQDKSQEIMGHAFKQMSRDSFVVSTKCNETSAEKLRVSLETSLEKLGVDQIDYFNAWGLNSAEKWRQIQEQGALDEMIKAREEGLIKNVVFSTHMTRTEAEDVFDKNIFAGVTLGYNAINFPFREQVVESAGHRGLGVVVMNPLSGGLIPQHAERFDFIRTDDDPDVVHAGLRFVLSNPAVTVALVGFSSQKEVDDAVSVTERFVPHDAPHREAIQKQITEKFEGLCTGCGYCLPCPQGISVPRMMDAYNMRILEGPKPEHIVNRLRNHWSIGAEEAEKCTQCGACEKKCTQHLPIISRLEDVVTAGHEAAAKGE